MGDIIVLDAKLAIEKLVEADKKFEDPLIYKVRKMIQEDPEHLTNILFGAFLISRKENKFLKESHLKLLQNSATPIKLEQ